MAFAIAKQRRLARYYVHICRIAAAEGCSIITRLEMKAGILLLLLAALVLAFLSFFIHGLDMSSIGYLTTEDGIITAVVIMGIICLVLVYLLYQRAVSRPALPR